MSKIYYSSIFLAHILIVFIYGHQFDPQVHIRDDRGTTQVTSGGTHSMTAQLYTNVNSLNITCGLDTHTDKSSHVNLTCLFNDSRVVNWSALGSSGTFALEVYGTRTCTCLCVVTDTSEFIIGKTLFDLTFTVVPYTPRVRPTIRYGNLTLTEGEELTINLGLLGEVKTVIACDVCDGYPRVSNITFTCDGVEKTTGIGYQVSSTFTLNRAWDGKRCVCSAGHDTGLYNIKSSFIFHILYVPTIEPVMYIGNSLQKNGSTFFFTSNYSVIEINCFIPDGNPKVTNISFTSYYYSEPEVIKNNGFERRYIAYLAGKGEAHYVCTGSHVTGLYKKETLVYVNYNVSPHVPTLIPDVLYKREDVLDGGSITDVVTVRSSTVYIVCRVFDGYPRVSNVSLQCGTFRQVIHSAKGVFAIPDAKVFDGERCVCSGQHVTGLYNKTSSFALHVLYQSSVTKMTANGASGYLSVQPGASVTIQCEADGNPKPQISLYGLRTGHGAFGGPATLNGTKLTRTFTASLATSDIYVCQADNAVDPINVGERLVEVAVADKVPSSVQRFTVNGQTTQLTVNVGDIVLFKCDTAGSSRRITLRGMTSEMTVYNQTTLLSSSQIVEWRNATCDFYDTFECRVDVFGNDTSADVSKTLTVKVNSCSQVTTVASKVTRNNSSSTVMKGPPSGWISYLVVTLTSTLVCRLISN